ncbi:MAG TPA: nucleoside deaminase [Acidimicrobiales bacterium]|nr:nucleoside deaminase [Acidimicrobiales bacterium]
MTDVGPAREVHATGARARWAALDPAWRRAFELAWEALGAGSIGVGAVVTDVGGEMVAQGRNRVGEVAAPPGQVAGSSLAHAEVNAVAQLPFRARRDLVLTTTLQPCLQCAAAIRFAPIARVRIAGADPLWDGCDDFRSLGPWPARRPPVPSEGPLRDEMGVFATLLARLSPWFAPHIADALRDHGEGPIHDLAAARQADGDVARLRERPVQDALVAWWPDLVEIAARRSGRNLPNLPS